ncbi:unnamed protein product [Lactuca saligna]|uniref:Uncharacterized protein n=1 Tax=Lactuca saligna TaxID=75948 RepID=A0AA35VWN9_LACSI|nr:unnamed protein product [Lactuca saligna]
MLLSLDVVAVSQAPSSESNPNSLSPVTTKHDLFSIPIQIPLPDTKVDSPSSSSEIRNTVEVGNIMSFEVDVDSPILKEVLGDDGENHIIK